MNPDPVLARYADVSIPLRKFRKQEDRFRVAYGKRGFHPSKEV